MEFDTVIHGGTIVTPTESWQGDLGLVGAGSRLWPSGCPAARAGSTPPGGSSFPAASRRTPISRRKAPRG